MRITYRSRSNKRYWESRWADIPVDAPMANLAVYPMKYAEMTIPGPDGPILEAGCGAGRVLRYYHDRGYDIVGIDFVESVIDKLKAADPTLKVEAGDIKNLRFETGSFRYVLAFGLYHGIEVGLAEAIAETFRVIASGGAVCASFRADNIQTRITDWLARRASPAAADAPKEFHKLNLSKSEFRKLFEQAGFVVRAIYPVENMPFLYKFAFFRAREHKQFNESLGRTEGYRLSRFGALLHGLLMRWMPDQFCNVYVLIATKP